MKKSLALFVCLLLYTGLLAARPLSHEEEVRWHGLTERFRCPTCQSGSIADSPVGLADDLRQEIRTQIILGKSDAQIQEFMVSRYGQFITYKPPLNAVTALLWFLPFLFLLLVLAGLWWFFRRNGAVVQESEP